MKVLFVAVGASPASVFAIAPLATAVRNAGHEVLVASFAELAPTVAAVGLPAVAVPTTATSQSIMEMSRPGGTIEYPWTPEKELPFLGYWFARQAAVTYPGLLEICRAWGADAVVGGTMAYVTSLLGARLGIPSVRQAWDWVRFDEAHHYADVELGAELDEHGLASVARPDLFLDICPPSLTPAGAGDPGPTRPMRWVPGNRQRPLEPWMYTPPERPRICLTYGSFRTADPDVVEQLCTVVERLLPLGAELVVAAGEPAAGVLTERFPEVRSGWVPLEVLAPTCDVLLHPNGGLTAMNAMASATPQVVFSRFRAFDESLRGLAAQGAAAVLYRGEDTPERIAAAAADVLGYATYARSAARLREEVHTMPPPPALVADIEALATGG